jgi:hypothetical protein
MAPVLSPRAQTCNPARARYRHGVRARSLVTLVTLAQAAATLSGCGALALLEVELRGDAGTVALEDGGGPRGTDAGQPVVDAGGEEAWAFSDRPCRLSIDITWASPVDGDPLVDFPVFLALDRDQLACGDEDRNPGGYLFIDDEGAALPFETTHNNAGEIHVWVRVATLPLDGSARLWLYYGNPQATPPANPGPVWRAPFVGVWHLDEDPQPNAELRDSSPNDIDGFFAGMIAGAQIDPGVFTRAHGLDGTGHHADFTNVEPLNPNEDSWTWSTWVRVSAAAGANDMALWRGGFNEPGYCLETGFDLWRVIINNGPSQIVAELGHYDDLRNDWHHIAGALDRDSDELIAYLDGQEVDRVDATNAGALATAYPLNAGNSWGGGQPLRGELDDVRVESVARSSAWLAAVAAQGHARVTTGEPAFYELGSPELAP